MADAVTETFMEQVEESDADVANVSAESFYRHDENYGGWRLTLDLKDPDDLPIVQEVAEEWPIVQDDDTGEVWVRGLE